MAKRIMVVAAIMALWCAAAVFAADTGSVSAKSLNLRSTPAIEPDNIVAKAANGDTLVILEEKDEWLKVRTEEGVEGWVAAVYVTRDSGSGPDPLTMLATAESIFDKSYTIRRNNAFSEYKEYNARRVLDAHELVDRIMQPPGPGGASDRALLLRGRCRTVMGWYSSGFPREFFLRNKKDFTYNEIAANYIYSGADFKELLKRYPDSALADDAAFEIANLPRGGECETDAACMMGGAFNSFEPFLKKYPSSPLAARAVEIINATGIFAWMDGASMADGMDVDRDGIQKLLDRYKAAAATLRQPERSMAYHAIADAWAALGRRDDALALYRKILAEHPSYEDADHIKKNIGDLKK